MARSSSRSVMSLLHWMISGLDDEKTNMGDFLFGCKRRRKNQTGTIGLTNRQQKTCQISGVIFFLSFTLSPFCMFLKAQGDELCVGKCCNLWVKTPFFIFWDVSPFWPWHTSSNHFLPSTHTPDRRERERKCGFKVDVISFHLSILLCVNWIISSSARIVIYKSHVTFSNLRSSYDDASWEEEEEKY